MFNSNPWMLLLWIIALVMSLIPLLLILWGGICAGYFRAKELHISRLASALGKTITQFAKKASSTDENSKKEEKE